MTSPVSASRLQLDPDLAGGSVSGRASCFECRGLVDYANAIASLSIALGHDASTFDPDGPLARYDRYVESLGRPDPDTFRSARVYGPDLTLGQTQRHECACGAARPDSMLEGKRVYESRRKMGEILWREAPVEADFVMPMPDSGRSAALGFAQESKIPFEEERMRAFIAAMMLATSVVALADVLYRNPLRRWRVASPRSSEGRDQDRFGGDPRREPRRGAPSTDRRAAARRGNGAAAGRQSGCADRPRKGHPNALGR